MCVGKQCEALGRAGIAWPSSVCRACAGRCCSHRMETWSNANGLPPERPLSKVLPVTSSSTCLVPPLCYCLLGPLMHVDLFNGMEEMLNALGSATVHLVLLAVRHH